MAPTTWATMRPDARMPSMRSPFFTCADAREALRSLPEEQVRAIIDRASAVSDVTVSRKGANPPWAHELS